MSGSKSVPGSDNSVGICTHRKTIFCKSNVAVGEGVGVGVGVGEGVGVAVGEGVGVGDGVKVGCFLATATPLFQTNFFPLLIQVYFLPL